VKRLQGKLDKQTTCITVNHFEKVTHSVLSSFYFSLKPVDEKLPLVSPHIQATMVISLEAVGKAVNKHLDEFRVCR
jgi:hypothetical protein